YLWAVPTGRLVASLHGLQFGDGFAAGTRLAAVHRDGRVVLAGSAALRVPRPGVLAVLGPGGRRLLVAGGRVLKLVETSSGEVVAARLPARATAARFSAGGSFAVGTAGGRVVLFSPRGVA